jgi:xanthine dehydrogenase small subunit
MNTQTIRFVRRGQPVLLEHVAPSRTLLEVLREDLACSGTKEGCGEGDCGACTVVLGELDGDKLAYRAVNSCIKLAHAVDGLALWTVEDLAAEDGGLHPAQQAMVQCHGSQCGFCTPGFVMSLFGMYQNHTAHGATISRQIAQEALSGNLCRCTGYKPILEAAMRMGDLPAVRVDETQVIAQLQQLAATPAPDGESQAGAGYMAPPTLDQLLRARAAYPNAQLVAGCTDVGLWITKMFMEFDSVLDLSRVRELRRIESGPDRLRIGAAVPLAEAYAALVDHWPQLRVFASRFAGLPVRNAGTMGGNVANGSPIGDSMPLLIALGASVVLQSVRGQREMALESLYTGYRKNVMAGDEVLVWIQVPLPAQTKVGAAQEVTSVGAEFMRIYKISKRFDDDISAICLALALRIDQGHVVSASIGVGGVAATPVRARKTEAALSGQAWTLDTVQVAIDTLRAEFQPISDMRASSAYRSEVLGNLLPRFWLESQGLQAINLDCFAPPEEVA